MQEKAGARSGTIFSLEGEDVHGIGDAGARSGFDFDWDQPAIDLYNQVYFFVCLASDLLTSRSIGQLFMM